MLVVFAIRVKTSANTKHWPVGSFVEFDHEDETPFSTSISAAFLCATREFAENIIENELDEACTFEVVELREAL